MCFDNKCIYLGFIKLKKRSKFLKRTGRYKEIISTCIAYGFSDIIGQIPTLRKFRFLRFFVKKHNGHKLTEYSHEQRIRMLLEELGPTFIKFGQILSNRHDILSPKLIKELSLLQSSVPPFDSEIAISIVENSLGDKIENIFLDFERESKSSASISQMHRATLLDGTKVATKIKRPDIETKIKLDIDILFDIAGLLQKYVSSIAIFDPVGIVSAFQTQITNELDFNYEKNNIKRFHKFFDKNNQIHIPKVYDKYSNKDILTMEFIEGVKISEVNKEKYNFDNTIILDNLVNSMFMQIFNFSFFHADPHPGNIFIQEGNIVAFIDFGMVGIINPSVKHSLSEMIYSIYNEDYSRFSKAIISITKLKNVENFNEFNNTVYEFIQRYINLAIDEIALEDVFNEILEIIHKYNLTIDPSVSLMAKTAVILEGVCRDIDPTFKIIEKLKPLIRHYILEQFSPKSFFKQTQNIFYNGQDTLVSLPKKLNNIMDMVEDGSIEIKFNHQGIDNLSNAFDRAINKLSYSVVLASIIISSGLIVHAKLPPFIFGDIPIIGGIGFLVSGIMGFILIFTNFIRYLRR